MSHVFFQAEDGIRDYKVTGVQTCALPISTAYDNVVAYQEGQGETELSTQPDLFAFMGGNSGSLRFVTQPDIKTYAALKGKRSEERRVGKECRSRWSPYH